MITVVIPLYNKEKQVRKTIESVVNQTFQNFEVIIVDDGSTDNSLRIVEEIQDDRLRIICQKNQGVSVARNTGIQNANYKYIALLDADDEWKPDYLSTQIELTQKYPTCDVFVCNYEIQYPDGTTAYPGINKLCFQGENGVLANYFEVASCSSPPICSINIVATKDAFLSVKGFPVGVKSGEDLLTWARLAESYSIAYSRKPLAVFNAPMFVTDRETRLEISQNDYIHNELSRLYEGNKKKRGLKKYVGHWNVMRCAVFLESGQGLKAFKPAWRALKYTGPSLKILFFILMSIFPRSLQVYIMEYKRKNHGSV